MKKARTCTPFLYKTYSRTPPNAASKYVRNTPLCPCTSTQTTTLMPILGMLCKAMIRVKKELTTMRAELEPRALTIVF
jgi:hypothetical protein